MGIPQDSTAVPGQAQGAVQAAQAPMPPPPPYRLEPPPGSRLASMCAQLAAARARVAEAKAQEKAIADGIKAEATRLAPEGTASVILPGGPGNPDWVCHWVTWWQLDPKSMKEKDPLTYVKWAVQKGTWKIEKAGG